MHRQLGHWSGVSTEDVQIAGAYSSIVARNSAWVNGMVDMVNTAAPLTYAANKAKTLDDNIINITVNFVHVFCMMVFAYI